MSSHSNTRSTRSSRKKSTTTTTTTGVYPKSSGASSDDCARGGDTSSSRSLRSWPRFSTTAHSATRRPGSGEGVRVEVHGQVPGEPPPRRQAPSTLPWTLTRGLSPVAPDQTGWHLCLEQIVDSVRGLLVLDAPVPQGKQLADALMLFDTMVPDVEQVIGPASQRSSLQDPLLAKQLVEVPTILYFLKQTVDIPGQGSTASSSSSHSPAGVLDGAEKPSGGGFSHFSLAQEKCEGWPAAECESARALQLIRAERSSNAGG